MDLPSLEQGAESQHYYSLLEQTKEFTSNEVAGCPVEAVSE